MPPEFRIIRPPTASKEKLVSPSSGGAAVLFILLPLVAIVMAALTLVGCHSKKPPNEGSYQVPTSQMYLFPDLEGPREISVVPPQPETSWRDYSTGSDSRLAILLTDENSQWLGLAHGLKTFGVPFIITTDYKAALKHRVVLVYPLISGLVCAPEELRALADYPSKGGTLIACSVLGGGLGPTFGFSEVNGGPHHSEIRFGLQSDLTREFSDPSEAIIRLEKTHGSLSYSAPRNPPLATFEDGSAAIIENSIPQGGHAYAFGFDLGQYILTGYNARQESVARSFANAYEPSIDVLLRLIQNIYRQGERRAAFIGTVPGGKDLSVMITHDVDFTKSIKNAVRYAEFEKAEKIPATYFIQTKYIRDFNDDIFFDPEGVECLRQVHALGGELGSHTVAHSRVFSKFPMGHGNEHYPTYAPFVKTRELAYNASLLGELRVSKFLLESQVPGLTVTSFRPGELSYPFRLPEALLASGYRLSSSTTANNCLTHLPFQLNYSRETESEVPLFEFPVCIEDEALPKMGERVPQAVEIARKLRVYGGLVVVLIHPDILDHKLQFEKDFVDAVRPYAWLATARDFATWWTARDGVSLDVAEARGKRRITLGARLPVRKLTVVPPPGWKLKQPPQGVTETKKGILIENLEANMTLEF